MGLAGLNFSVDPEEPAAATAGRRPTPLTEQVGRSTYRISHWLARARVTAPAVRVASLAFSAAVPFVASLGGPFPTVAAALVLLAAIAGTLDGPVAASRGRVTRLGALYDPVVDRVDEVCWLLALWLIGAPAWLVVVCGVLMFLFEYVRARAVAVGMSGRGVAPVGGRGVRVCVVTGGLALAGLGGVVHANFGVGMVTVAVTVWAFLGLLGLVQLSVAVYDALR